MLTTFLSTTDGERVTQRMRWMEPGSFLMGSPDGEKERVAAEGPQHRVTLEQGFWVFDTACTQALWQAVMGGKNPSRFRGASRPVESVSWDDVQRFVQTLNERVPGLGLTLPSEAQWEYACRASSTTPFSFGETITPEQVNYNGAYPYLSGEKGWNRQETVPVGSLPPNKWGLYEMHGNVWEWVQDPWHGNYESAPADGTVWDAGTEAGAKCVIRGGSWYFYATHCRCAYRSAYGPGNLYNYLGFRCARVQGRELSKPEGAAAPGGRVVRYDRPENLRPHVAAHMNREAGRMRASLLRLDLVRKATMSLPQAAAFRIVTDRERLNVRRMTKPAWASAIGRDGFGLWAEITVEPSVGEPAVQRLRWIPPGQFKMGSPAGEPGRNEEEGPQHQVTITSGYWLFDAPCTQALWEAVLGENPSEFRSPQRPVESVSWNDVQQRFLPALNARIPGFVLPSEAQWEYACRAATDSALYSGAIEILGDGNAPALDPIAWYGGNSSVDFELENGQERRWLTAVQFSGDRAGTHPVKGKQANPWGLYDMLGNVWELVQDPWHDRYWGAPKDGTAWEADANPGGNCVVRGGAWGSFAYHCRCAVRMRYRPEARDNILGFRCARVLGS